MKKNTLKAINIDLPQWMVTRLDKEARRLGINRKSMINFLLSQSLTPRPIPVPFSDEGYLRHVQESFSKEWNSSDDDEGFGRL